ncbi:hypothetical protein ACS0TY_000311 [Phlomoides rotata]
MILVVRVAAEPLRTRDGNCRLALTGYTMDVDLCVASGAEVKAGEPLKVTPGDDMVLHLSQFFSVISTEIPEGESGKPEPKAKKEKPIEIEKAKASKGKEADVGKQTVKTVQPNNEDAESSDDVVSEDDDDDSVDEGDSDDSEGEASKSDEETPKKAETSKKRAPESSIKTPVQDKKAKITPQRTNGKRVSGHVATPYPTKQGKTPANKR